MNNIEREPNNREFTRAELMMIHRALINENINNLFPPVSERDFEVVASACAKVVKLITEYDDRQYESDE